MANLHLKVSFFVLFFAFISLFAGPVEGRLFPVNTTATITRMAPAENGYTRIWGTFSLLRTSCNFAGLEWDLLGERRNVAAIVIFEEGTKERDGGFQDFGPWLVQLTPDQIEQNSRAVVYHDCPFRWWKTESLFYPAEW